jgi:hypothetical protein
MSTRLKGLTIALEGDIREDDAENIILAIKQIRGILDVTPIEADSNDWINRSRIKSELQKKLWDIVSN